MYCLHSCVLCVGNFVPRILFLVAFIFSVCYKYIIIRLKVIRLVCLTRGLLVRQFGYMDLNDKKSSRSLTASQ